MRKRPTSKLELPILCVPKDKNRVLSNFCQTFVFVTSLLQAGRGQNTDSLTEQERTLATFSTEISFEKSQLQGFWIAVRNGIDISIGRIGDKIINPLANYSDIIREGD